MYANVDFTTERRDKALVVPTNAVVDINGSRGVFLPGEGDTAKFKTVNVGMIDGELAEVSEGLERRRPHRHDGRRRAARRRSHRRWPDSARAGLAARQAEAARGRQGGDSAAPATRPPAAAPARQPRRRPVGRTVRRCRRDL